MLKWLGENYATILAGLAVAAIVIGPMIAGRARRAKGGCPSGCSGCPYSGSCRR